MAEQNIKYQGISTLEVLEDAHNYNSWIAEQIKQYIKKPSLEIGAGTGNLTNYFIANKAFYISENDPGLVRHLQQRFSKHKDVLITRLNIANEPPKKFCSFFSSIFAINVLEHIQDDQSALVNIHSMLQTGGKLILLVPAKKFAYTKLDKQLGHYRRYERDELREKLKNAGYEIEKIYFFNILGLLSWIIRDKVKQKNIQLKSYHIKIFDKIVPLLRVLESKITVPLGISLITVARKI